MTPQEAATFVARHGARPGDSVPRTADAILRDRDTFRVHYRRAAQTIARRPFATLMQAHTVLTKYHDQREEPRDRDPD